MWYLKLLWCDFKRSMHSNGDVDLVMIVDGNLLAVVRHVFNSLPYGYFPGISQYLPC
jgi:hypothetical protein